jgi:hypothetical protein
VPSLRMREHGLPSTLPVVIDRECRLPGCLP